MTAVGTDFESPVTWPTPGSTEYAASWPDDDEAVGRKASQPHPVAPAWGSPMPAPLTEQPPPPLVATPGWRFVAFPLDRPQRVP